MQQKGELSVGERDEEIALIRVVTDMLMAAKEDEKIKGMINEIKDEEGVRLLQSVMPREIKVNRYVVAEAMGEGVKLLEDGKLGIGKFNIEIDISKIKAELENKDVKFNMFNKKNEELINLISAGLRGQDAVVLSPMLRNARAVAAAA